MLQYLCKMQAKRYAKLCKETIENRLALAVEQCDDATRLKEGGEKGTTCSAGCAVNLMKGVG